MFDILGKDKTFNALEQVMDVASARHAVIASNIANVDTPGYKAMDIAFKEQLQIAVKRMERPDEPIGSRGELEYTRVFSPRVFQVDDVTPRQDGNTVDMDRELGKLAKTTGVFSKASTMFSMKLKMLKDAIKGD